MLGLSYGQLLLIIGAAAALTGPKDFPRISRAAGKLAGRAIAYVQLARSQFDSVMQQTQAKQMHKELQDTMAQLEAIRHEIRPISFLNPGISTTRLVDNLDHASATNVKMEQETVNKDNTMTASNKVDSSSNISSSSNIHSQVTSYERLAESAASKSGSLKDEAFKELTNASGLLTVLPASAESAGLLPKCRDDVNGSDLVLEAIVEGLRQMLHIMHRNFSRNHKIK